MTTTSKKSSDPRFEFRVWGRREDLVERLASLADVDRTRELTDCYLLTSDPTINVKIRHSRLKIKRLVEERAGLQRWASTWHRRASDAPKPFDVILSELAERCEDSTNGIPLATSINAIKAIEGGTMQAVAVKKYRRRFRLGTIRAEAAELVIADRPDRLSTVAIEGRHIDDLLQLRADLGLSAAQNMAIHLAIDAGAATNGGATSISSDHATRRNT